jgi:5-methylcytosine-specific restriction endonuclease McrA
MGNRKQEFSSATKQKALERQRSLCASCGTRIFGLDEVAREKHRFGEGARAHHIVHIKFGGTNQIENCVIVCDSCHYSIHEGGNYKHGTVIGTPEDFPHYHR